MLGCEVFLHELLVEDFASDTAWCNEACDNELENDQNDSQAHISVEIKLLLVSEEHKEESEW